jgi:hypothetical protein
MNYDEIVRMAREADEYATERQCLNSRQFTDSRLNLQPDDPEFNVSWQELRDRHFARLVIRRLHNAQVEARRQDRKEKRERYARDKAARSDK